VYVGAAARDTSYGTGENRMEPLRPKTDVIHREIASIFVPKTGRGLDADNLPCMSARRRATRVTERVNIDLNRSGQKRTYFTAKNIRNPCQNRHGAAGNAA